MASSGGEGLDSPEADPRGIVPPMLTRAVLGCGVLLLCAVGCRARPEPVAMAVVDSAELQTIVAADRADRQQAVGSIDWANVGPRDAARRTRVLRLIADDRLRTSRDFNAAALVFQHGDTPDDILLAHVLAVTALGIENPSPEGRRMAAVTLDRYLTRSGQGQIFGTQFNTPDVGDPGKWTMDPWNETLISDTLRRLNCVESRAASRALLDRLKSGVEPEEPPPVCAPTKPTGTE
jgi:hypothetical protein